MTYCRGVGDECFLSSLATVPYVPFYGVYSVSYLTELSFTICMAGSPSSAESCSLSGSDSSSMMPGFCLNSIRSYPPPPSAPSVCIFYASVVVVPPMCSVTSFVDVLLYLAVPPSLCVVSFFVGLSKDSTYTSAFYFFSACLLLSAFLSPGVLMSEPGVF